VSKRKTPEEKINIAIELALKEIEKEIKLSSSSELLLRRFGKICIYRYDKDVKLSEIELDKTVWSSEMIGTLKPKSNI
jgi:hypothetical protein